MKNIRFNILVLMFIAFMLFNCKKEEITMPKPKPSCCDLPGVKDSTFVAVENSGPDDKTFRIYGGGTGLDSVDSNSVLGFNTGTGFDNTVRASAIQSDGKVLLGGQFTSYNGTTANRIIRLNTDGTIDGSFVYGTGFNGHVFAITIQSDGKILIGGLFTSYNGTSANRIIRLNSDGSVDPTFVYGTGFDSIAYKIVIQSDGRILIGGDFNNYNGVAANRIIRLASTGSIDGSFVYGSGFDGTVYGIVVQSDNKILIGGDFALYDGVSANGIVRLSSTGSIDGSFVYGSGFDNAVNSLAIQSDGSIIAGGDFNSYNGTTANKIIRLTSTGSIDGSFVYGTGFSHTVYMAVIQSDGKIVLGGQFVSYNGITANFLIRITSTGAVDPTFIYGTGFNNIVYTVGLAPDDETIYMAGLFTEYNGDSENFIMGLNDDASAKVNYTPVDITVNGGQIELVDLNADTGPNPICICEIQINAEEKDAYKNLFYKKQKSSTGQITSESIPLLSKFTANQATGVNTVVISGKEFKDCVLNGSNYLEWVVPAESSVTLNIKYCQYDRSANLGARKGAKTKKKYVHGAFKYYIN